MTLEEELGELKAERSDIDDKTCLRVVRPISEVPLEHPRTLRTGLRLANEIKKVGRKWRGSMKSSYCMIGCRLDSFYLSFPVIRRISFLFCLLHSGLYNTLVAWRDTRKRISIFAFYCFRAET